jgi:hypothetical protein
MKKTVIAMVVAAALGVTSQAQAAAITYTLQGFGVATVGNSLFEGAFSIVGKGDTNNFLHPPQAPTANVVALNSLTVNFGGTTITSIDPAVFFTNPPASYNGFNIIQGANIATLLGFRFQTPNTYDARGDFGPAPTSFVFSMTRPGPFPQGQFMHTDLGLFQWGRVDATVFTARLDGGVPEPAAWALMLAGFGLAGAALRRKTRVTAQIA